MTNLLSKQGLNDKQLLMVEQEYESKKKQTWIMWLIFALVGGGGFHRMYIGDMGYGLLMLGVTVLVSWATLGLATLTWIIIELFLIQKRLRFKNEQLELEIINKVRIMTQD